MQELAGNQSQASCRQLSGVHSGRQLQEQQPAAQSTGPASQREARSKHFTKKPATKSLKQLKRNENSSEGTHKAIQPWQKSTWPSAFAGLKFEEGLTWLACCVATKKEKMHMREENP